MFTLFFGSTTLYAFSRASGPQKQPVKVFFPENDHRRPAMGATEGVGGLPELGQKCSALLARERCPGLYGTPACDHLPDSVYPRGPGLFATGKDRRKKFPDAHGVHLPAEHDRHRTDSIGPSPELLDVEPHLFEAGTRSGTIDASLGERSRTTGTRSSWDWGCALSPAMSRS